MRKQIFTMSRMHNSDAGPLPAVLRLGSAEGAVAIRVVLTFKKVQTPTSSAVFEKLSVVHAVGYI